MSEERITGETARSPIFSEKRRFEEKMDSDDFQDAFMIFNEEVDIEEILDKFTDIESKNASQSVLNLGETVRQMMKRTTRIYTEMKDKYRHQILEGRKKKAVE
jgi:hypothetical protein